MKKIEVDFLYMKDKYIFIASIIHNENQFILYSPPLEYNSNRF